MTATTKPMRTLNHAWQVGDMKVDLDGTRWVIRGLNRNTGRVVLEAMNATNAGVWWNTTIDKLGEKAA